MNPTSVHPSRSLSGQNAHQAEEQCPGQWVDPYRHPSEISNAEGEQNKAETWCLWYVPVAGKTRNGQYMSISFCCWLPSSNVQWWRCSRGTTRALSTLGPLAPLHSQDQSVNQCWGGWHLSFRSGMCAAICSTANLGIIVTWDWCLLLHL